MYNQGMKFLYYIWCIIKTLFLLIVLCVAYIIEIIGLLQMFFLPLGLSYLFKHGITWKNVFLCIGFVPVTIFGLCVFVIYFLLKCDNEDL